jgi:sulfoxide reductase heme-binding subunit YedZ
MTMRKRNILPWRERNGRLSLLKLAVFLSLFVPGLWNGVAFALDDLGARPLHALIHILGLWALRLVFIALAITPLRRSLDWPQLLKVRRMVGVAAFAYAMAHLTAYAADQAFDLAKVASEIIFRFYLTIGFAALLGLAALAATSTDKMIRRIGGVRWQRLHRLVYLIAILGNLHYFLQSKLEVFEPIFMGGLLFWLLAYRLVAARTADGELRLVGVAVLSLAAVMATALGEATYFALKFGVAPMRILATDVSLAAGLRPAWLVLIAVAIVTLATAFRRLGKYRQRRLEPA